MKVLCIRDITLTNGLKEFILTQGKTYIFADNYAKDLIKEGYAKFLLDYSEVKNGNR